jgi:hypothetical protein
MIGAAALSLGVLMGAAIGGRGTSRAGITMLMKPTAGEHRGMSSLPHGIEAAGGLMLSVPDPARSSALRVSYDLRRALCRGECCKAESAADMTLFY